MVKEVEWKEIEDEYPTEYDEEREDYFVLMDDIYHLNKMPMWKRAKYLIKREYGVRQKYERDTNSLKYLET